ncbi:MAG: HipA domain-containing protein [Clostridia bacterium]|nr:HipA domain-containing protein [Clostridia bacterium]
MIDFTNCERILSKAYNGANGKKIAVSYQGIQYMLKFPPSGAAKKTNLSYTNSCISEYIGSNIFNMLGLEAQKTILGTYDVGGKTKIVCACRDFTADGMDFYDFCSIKNTVIDSGHEGTGTELEEILESIEKQVYVNPVDVMEHFWDMFVVDAFLGNFDRHNGNWGFLVDRNANTAEIAPIFDCGSCLLPQADETVMKNVLSNEDEMNARVYQFPTSAIKLDNAKINYYDFLMSEDNEACNEALARIVPRINMQEVEALIEAIPCISDLQKEFYIAYLHARYENILLPAYEQIMGEDEGMSLTM